MFVDNDNPQKREAPAGRHEVSDTHVWNRHKGDIEITDVRVKHFSVVTHHPDNRD